MILTLFESFKSKQSRFFVPNYGFIVPKKSCPPHLNPVSAPAGVLLRFENWVQFHRFKSSFGFFLQTVQFTLVQPPIMSSMYITEFSYGFTYLIHWVNLCLSKTHEDILVFHKKNWSLSIVGFLLSDLRNYAAETKIWNFITITDKKLNCYYYKCFVETAVNWTWNYSNGVTWSHWKSRIQSL